MTPISVPHDRRVYAFSARDEPAIRVSPGTTLRFVTTDSAYDGLTGRAIDAGLVDFRRVNALTGPVCVDGAMPGDALGFRVEAIDLGERAFAVFVGRWRSRMFGMAESHVVEVPVESGVARLPSGGVIEPRPMIGCCGVAPAKGTVSGLSPTARTGGNMDLVELAPGATIWFPVESPGGGLALGDVHVRMGRGEPLGSGLECAATVTGMVRLATGRAPEGPVVVEPDRLSFVGTSEADEHEARAAAVGAAWRWLTATAGTPLDDALAICAALLELETGGPAGANMVASFGLADLARAGVPLDCWPLAGA